MIGLKRPPETIDASLNEVEMLTVKAARGAGLSWGLAEDVGRSARWLAHYPISWAESLLMLLSNEIDSVLPVLDSGYSATPTSAIRLGAFLSDSASERLIGTSQLFSAVAYPIWALPPLVDAAHGLGLFVSVRIAEIHITIEPSRMLRATASLQALCAVPAAELRVQFSNTPMRSAGDIFPFLLNRASVPKESWEKLEALALRTYVPASITSRGKGAGAGPREDD